jgi:hypothetical protein
MMVFFFNFQKKKFETDGSDNKNATSKFKVQTHKRQKFCEELSFSKKAVVHGGRFLIPSFFVLSYTLSAVKRETMLTFTRSLFSVVIQSVNCEVIIPMISTVNFRL